MEPETFSVVVYMRESRNPDKYNDVTRISYSRETGVLRLVLEAGSQVIYMLDSVSKWIEG